jgi:hypothetical protein
MMSWCLCCTWSHKISSRFRVSDKLSLLNASLTCWKRLLPYIVSFIYATAPSSVKWFKYFCPYYTCSAISFSPTHLLGKMQAYSVLSYSSVLTDFLNMQIFMYASPPLFQLLLCSSEIMWNDICPFNLLLSSMKMGIDTDSVMPISAYDGTNSQHIALTKTSLISWLWVSLFPHARPVNTNVFRFVRSYVPIGSLWYFWLNCVCVI